MNLIDRYIAEVGRHLPGRNRADIQAEIRSTLEDMLEERKPAHGAVDEAMTIELLKEYGPPRKVAESYTGPRYLIGPRIYPLFELVTKIVLTVLVVLALVGLALRLAGTELVGLEFARTVGESALDLFTGLMTAFGNLVLVFVILERVLPAKDLEEEEEWTPTDLAKEPDPDRVQPGEHIFEIIFTVFFLVIFNLYPNVIGLWFFQGDESVFISPILTEAFFSYLPWINVLFLLQLIFRVYLLRRAWWNTGLRILNVLSELANIVLAAVMLRGPALVALTADQLSGTPLEEADEVFTWIFHSIPALVLTIVILLSAIDVAQTIHRLWKNRPSSPYPVLK